MTTSLYRFRPLNNHTLDELRNSYLYFSAIDGLNDPMECFYLLCFDENERFYKNLFKHFLAVMHIVSVDSTLGGKESFKKDLARQVFEFEKNSDILKGLDFDRWIDEYCQDIIRSLANRQVWENEIKKHLMEIYEQFYCGNDNALKHAESRIIKYLEQIRKFVISEVVVCCFSELGGSKTLTNQEILMWAHYADGHSGICMEFSDIVESNTNFGDKIKPKLINYDVNENDIKYLEFSVGLALSNNDDFKLKFLPERIMIIKDKEKFYNKKYQYIYNAKFKAWENEREYRITIHKSDLPKQKLKYDFSCLKSITFGVNTPHDKQNEIIEIVRKKNPKIVFYKVEIDENRGVLVRNYKG